MSKRHISQLPSWLEYRLTDDMLKLFPSLETLTLYNGVTDKGLKHVPGLKNLSLRYNDTITNKGLSYIPQLQLLDLTSNNIITDRGLKSLENLRALNLCRNNKITNGGLRFAPKLSSLWLRENSKITDRGLRQLSVLKNLSVCYSAITDKGLKGLNLQSLDASQKTYVTDCSVKDMKSLIKLDISYNINFYNFDLPYLVELTAVCNPKITRELLMRHPNLEKVNITDTGISPASLKDHAKIKDCL